MSGNIDEKWTQWKQSLQIATVFRLQPNENWLEHDELCPKIQIKRMNASNLNDEHDNIPVSDHPYDDMLDVVKLPMAIPEYDVEYAPEFLFIRPDDYDLFFCMHLRRKIILLGNPGISKSWFHWKYLLFCYHPELYNTFKPKHDAQEVDMSDKNQKKPAKRSGEKKLPTITKIPRADKFDDIPTIPEVVVRTVSGTRSQIFVVNSNDSVKVVKHSPQDLQDFTTSNMTILWEPSSKKTEVEYLGIMAQIIATLSPDIDRYKEFAKNGAKPLYLPCPSEVQLRLMGQIIRDANVGNVLDETIQGRIQTYGPFTRLILSPDESILMDYKASRSREMGALGKFNLGKLLANIVDISGQDGTQFSHRIVRYMVNRNDDKMDFYGYWRHFFVSTCDAVASEIRKKIMDFDLETIKEHLVNIDSGSLAIEEFNPTYLQKLAVLHSTNEGGLQWKSRSLTIKTSEWKPKLLQLDKQENFVKDSKMTEKTLYYPSDLRFPLVDMYWQENKTLCAIQATSSESHPKPKKTYETFFKKLEVDIHSIDFHLYYLILPSKEPYYSENKVYPRSTFYKNVKKLPDDFGTNFKFFAICPPNDFGNGIN